jgi:hypothetical protein
LKSAIITVVFFFLCIFPAFASIDHTSSETLLKENKSSVNFLGTSVTNFGDQKTDQFKEIYELHFNGHVSYLQSDYKKTFTKVYQSQEKQIELFSYLLNDFYFKDSKDILDTLAPLVIRSKNAKARLYLTLGYRERAVGKNDFVSASASNPKLRFYKLTKFMNAVKRARRAKRYAFLSLFESQTDEVKREIYNFLFDTEMKSGNKFFNRFLGKKDKIFISELSSEYSDQKSADGESKEKNQGKKEELEKLKEEHKVQDPAIEKKKEVFETKDAKRSRFRNEKRAAEYLMNYQFDKAHDIISKYIDDLNYKMILATFGALSAPEPGKGADTHPVDYKRYKIHHTDNYARLSKQSVIETLADKIKIDAETKVTRDDLLLKEPKKAEDKKDKKADDEIEEIKDSAGKKEIEKKKIKNSN